MPASQVFVGCAGWSLRKEQGEHFPAAGSHLERYAGRFNAVEINSSFYRPHLPATYNRWAASVPEDFRFAVKVPKEITHERRLVSAADRLDRFLQEAKSLGCKLGPFLVQVPPSLAYSAVIVRQFFAEFRERFDGDLACEPRHVSWFQPEASQLLAKFQVARVAADPFVVTAAAEPGGWEGLQYYRLHGSPKMYYSSYPAEYLDALCAKLARRAASVPAWCIFDNTALGAATINALDLLKRFDRQS